MQGNLKQKITSGLALAALLLYFGGRLYFMSDFNEKYFDLPVEISYAEVAAVRLEKLTDEPLTRTGDVIDPDMEGLRFEGDFIKGRSYEIKKEMGSFKNYGVDYRHELGTKKHMKTEQKAQTPDEELMWLKTMYHEFHREKSAVRQYDKAFQTEKEMNDIWRQSAKYDWIPEKLSVEDAYFDDLHVCHKEYENSVATHIICRQGTRVMELNHSAREMVLDKLLEETKAVFAARN